MLNQTGESGSTNPIIRRAEPKDASEISGVLYRSFIEFRPMYTPSAFEVTVLSDKGVKARIDEGPVWVGLIGGRILGTVSVKTTPDGLYVRGMAVVPEARGFDLGRKFLEISERFAEKSGLDRMYLSTTPFLIRAIRLYERYGFQRIDDGPYDLFGTPLFTMEKTVRPSSL